MAKPSLDHLEGEVCDSALKVDMPPMNAPGLAHVKVVDMPPMAAPRLAHLTVRSSTALLLKVDLPPMAVPEVAHLDSEVLHGGAEGGHAAHGSADEDAALCQVQVLQRLRLDPQPSILQRLPPAAGMPCSVLALSAPYTVRYKPAFPQQ